MCKNEMSIWTTYFIINKLNLLICSDFKRRATWLMSQKEAFRIGFRFFLYLLYNYLVVKNLFSYFQYAYDGTDRTHIRHNKIKQNC